MKLTFILFSLLYAKVNSFFVGVATSSYQIEGQNKGISIWDSFLQNKNLHPVGNATNHFLLYKDDIKLMNDLGIKHYRFSISWTRIMPFEWNKIDPEGIQFYHNIIDECLKYNITPYATIYHWDLPNYLDVNMGSWLNEEIIYYFLEYSKILFNEYSNKVKFWMTINEPLTTSKQGYGSICSFAPGNCSINNQFESARNQLLAHAYVGNYYKMNYNGDIGMVINTNWIEPIDNNQFSINNSLKQIDESFGWFMNPLFFGEYPNIYKNILKPFNDTEKDILMDSFTFLGINHYTTYYVNSKGHNSVSKDWTQGKSTWLFDQPRGLKELLLYIKKKYSKTIPIYITESGFSQKFDGILDLDRTHYLIGYINEALKCYKNGMKNLKGFFIWSFLDNFEWASGYNETFGIINVDFKNYTRNPKFSSSVIKELIKNL